jgi:hypothetical protein
MASSGNLRPVAPLNCNVTREESTYYAAFSSTVTVSLCFKEAYDSGQMTGTVNPSYPKLSDSALLKTVSTPQQAAMYIGYALKHISQKVFEEFTSVDHIQIGSQWIHGSNSNDLLCAARTMLGIRIPKDVLRNSLAHYNVPYNQDLQCYTIAKPMAIKPRTAFLNGTKNSSTFPIETQQDALNRLINEVGKNSHATGDDYNPFSGAFTIGAASVSGSSANSSGGKGTVAAAALTGAATARAPATATSRSGGPLASGSSANSSGGKGTVAAAALTGAATARAPATATSRSGGPLASGSSANSSGSSANSSGLPVINIENRLNRSSNNNRLGSNKNAMKLNSQQGTEWDSDDEGGEMGDEPEEIDPNDETNGEYNDRNENEALLSAAHNFEDIIGLEVEVLEKDEDWCERKARLVTSIHQLALEMDLGKQGLKSTIKLIARKVFPFWLKRGDNMLGALKRSLLLLDRITTTTVASALDKTFFTRNFQEGNADFLTRIMTELGKIFTRNDQEEYADFLTRIKTELDKVGSDSASSALVFAQGLEQQEAQFVVTYLDNILSKNKTVNLLAGRSKRYQKKMSLKRLETRIHLEVTQVIEPKAKAKKRALHVDQGEEDEDDTINPEAQEAQQAQELKRQKVRTALRERILRLSEEERNSLAREFAPLPQAMAPLPVVNGARAVAQDEPPAVNVMTGDSGEATGILNSPSPSLSPSPSPSLPTPSSSATTLIEKPIWEREWVPHARVDELKSWFQKEVNRRVAEYLRQRTVIDDANGSL